MVPLYVVFLIASQRCHTMPLSGERSARWGVSPGVKSRNSFKGTKGTLGPCKQQPDTVLDDFPTRYTEYTIWASLLWVKSICPSVLGL
jgi:hypothetical protein